MMMKKTTSALAVAALLGTGAASAATFQVNDNSSLTVGGDIQFAYYDIEGSETNFSDNGSSLVFSGEQMLDDGLTTSFYLDFDEFGTTGGDGGFYSDGLVTDEYHVSFAGDFGEVKIGNEGDVTGGVFDVVDVAWGSGIANQPTGGASSEVVQYIGNSFNGISYALQAQVNGEAQEVSGGSSTSFAGYIEADLGSMTLAGGYAERANTTNDETFGVSVSTAISGVSLSANHVVEENADDKDESHTGLAASYGYGLGSLYGAFNSISIDNAGSGVQDDFSQYVVGVTYDITPNALVALEMLSNDKANDADDETVLAFYYGW
jgi:predicted porin